MKDGKRSALGVVYRKELLDSLRDRRALISMIVVPLVVMPLLLLGMGGLSFSLAEKAREEVHDVAVLGADFAPRLVEELEALEHIRVVEPGDDFEKRIADKELQAALRVPEEFAEKLRRGEAVDLTIYTYTGEGASEMAARRLESFLSERKAAEVHRRLREAGLSERLLEPFQVARENVAPPERVMGVMIGGLLPYIVIMLCITGALYPAMDLTAGEKERGTMETLLCSPVSRTTIVLGKFLVVLTFSVTTALFAVSALGATFGLAANQMQSGGLMTQLALSPMAIGGFFILLLPVAALFSALLLALSVFARTFREAQTYVSPLMVVAILPAVVALMPGVELTPLLVWVPVLNISLIGRDILSGIYDWGYIVAILTSSTLYAAIALGIAVKLFHKESVVFRG